MSTEKWLVLFEESLREYARALAAELKEVDPGAEARERTFATFLAQGLFCPECWVRNGHATQMHQKRWLISCGEHDYNVPHSPTI